MRNLFTCCLLVLCMFSLDPVYGQEDITIRGKVTDSLDGSGIPGVTVLLKGTGRATQTNANGDYSIETPASGGTLVFSFISYRRQEVPISGRTEINVVMTTESTVLDQVVVVGYGTQRQRDLTTAITTVRTDDIVKTPNAQAMQSLQGRVAGLQVVSGGAPGTAPTVRLRGIGSFEGGSAPLYVVDGMFFDNIDFLSPNDIETISVLKDASAAAIYGVRAGNGVILIETKSGQYNQKSEIVYDGYYGVQNPQNVLKMANSQQFVQYINETGAPADITFVGNAIQRYGRSRIDPSIPDVNTDWYSEIMGPAPIQNHNLSFNGGSENTRYSLGGSYFLQEGLLENTRNNYERLNFRVKVDSDVKEWLNVGGNFNVSTATQYVGEDAAWFNAYFAVPIMPVYDPLNTDAYPLNLANAQQLGYRGRQNPFFPLEYIDNRNNVTKVLGNFHADVKIIPEKLSFRTQYNFSFDNVNTRRVEFEYQDGIQFFPSGLRRQHASNSGQVWDNFLTYDDNFGKHKLNVVLGQSYRSEYNELLFARGQALDPRPTRGLEHYWYLSNFTEIDEDDIGDTDGNTINANLQYLSFFGRASYNYDDRYLLYGTYRRDGNNKFQQKWGNFATIGAGWIITGEDFFDVEGIDFLKLRASWGQLGNDGIGPSVGVPTFQENNLAINNVRYIGRRLNPTFDLITAWETTVEYNLGLDAQFLNNRLSVTADYFIRDTKNLAISVIPPVFRADERRSVGEIRNRGLELSLNWNDWVSDDFSYSIGGNIATLNNEVRSLGGPTHLDAGSAEFRQRHILGQPYDAFFGYEVAGVFQTTEQVQNIGYSPEFISANNLQPGDLIFVDQNGDGVIDDEDRVVLGSYLPTFTYGFNLGFRYKKWDFAALFQGQANYHILNRKRGELIFTNDTNIDADLANNLWQGPGTSDQYPSAAGLRRSWNQNMSNYFVEDGSYFRIQNVRLSYTFFGKDYRGGLLPETRLTFTAERPLTVFNYNGFNPEVANGIDRQVYPIPAIYTLGLNIKF